VSRGSTDVSTATRARWLAELAEAIEEAQELVIRLAAAEGRRAEALDLSVRLGAARAEVQSLRRNRITDAAGHIDPDWSKQLPWERALPRCDG
jgi:acyl-CoA reductase-like NAD-dependent aldehyde dehydrogenase